VASQSLQKREYIGKNVSAVRRCEVRYGRNERARRSIQRIAELGAREDRK
jgi:hypothetical protein